MLLNCGAGESLESPLDCKEIKLVHPKGNQLWIFIGKTDAEAEVPILWPPGVKSQLIVWGGEHLFFYTVILLLSKYRQIAKNVFCQETQLSFSLLDLSFNVN